MTRLLAWIFCGVALCGCSAPATQSLYDGLRSQEKAKGNQAPTNPNAMPNFQQYQEDREKLKGGN